MTTLEMLDVLEARLAVLRLQNGLQNGTMPKADDSPLPGKPSRADIHPFERIEDL